MDAKGQGSAWPLVLVLALTSAGAGPAAAQTLQAGDLTLDPSGRVQVQLNTTSVGGDDVAHPPASSAFETRRVRFGTGFAYGDWITGKVEADFSGGGARLTDGYADLALAPAVRVRAGQFKKPFGRFELESSTTIRTIERGLRIRGLRELVAVPAEAQFLLEGSDYVGRAIGVMAHGRLDRLGYAAGVFNGEGANAVETAGSKALAGRLTYDAGDQLVLGGGVSVQPAGASGGADRRGSAFSVDATWGGFRQPGLTVMAEWMRGDNPLAAAPDDPPIMTGAQAVAAWFAPRSGRVEGVESVLRLSWADPDTESDGDEGVLLTPGLSLYFNGRNRVMVNTDVYLPGQDGLDPELALVAQLQVHF